MVKILAKNEFKEFEGFFHKFSTCGAIAAPAITAHMAAVPPEPQRCR